MKLFTRLCLLVLFFNFSVLAEENTSGSEGPLTLNMQDADIGALIETVSYITGKNFIVDPRVTGKITIVSSVPTEPEKLYDLFLSVLRVYGFAAIESGNVVKIIPDANAKFENTTEFGDISVINDESSTLLIRMENVSAVEMVPILRPLLPQTAHLAAHAGSNMLIATDSKSNLARLQKIIKRIDLDNDRSIEVIRLQHANAADLVQTILPNFQGGNPKARVQQDVSDDNINLVADTRTNSILLSGNRKDRLEVRALISHLDTPVEQQGDTEVIYLKYAVASELVPILQRLGGRLGITDEEQRQQQQRTSASGSETLFEIEADDNMNALIVYAPPERLRAIKSVVNQLDIRRAQVLVEGVIAEVSYDKSIELGVQWQTSAPNDGFFAGSRQTVAEGVTPSISSFAVDALTGGLNLGFFSSGSLRGLLNALETDGFSNILSTPTLMTMDNEEAEIVIGQNVPFITGQFTNNTTTPDNPFQTIERQDVGIVLKVRPQINEGDSVKLEIEQEISSIDTSTNGADLITNKRSLKTNVLVDDNSVVVLGGLLSDDLRENQNKIPVLGDLPILGTLFRNTRDQVVKQNLMIFLRPTIIRDQRTNSRLTKNKYNFIREEQTQLKDRGVTLMPSLEISDLPEFKEVERTDMNFIRSRIMPK